MLKELVKLANHLDQKGLRKEADELDRIIRKYSEENQQVGASGMSALKRYIDQLYGYKISYSVYSKEKDKTTYSVTDYDDKHYNHMKGRAEKKDTIEHSGKTFYLSLGRVNNCFISASGGHRQYSSYEIEIEKPIGENKEDRFGNIPEYKTKFIARKLKDIKPK